MPAYSWFETVAIAQERSRKALPESVYKALIAGTEGLDPNRAFAVDIAVTIARALERDSGDD